jgi:hypothetical protein
MMTFSRTILFFLMLVPVLLFAVDGQAPEDAAEAETETVPDASSAWLEERSMEKFQFLLDRSPFSLPTAEENAPMADRFFLTGAATINEEPVVFVFDKNTQMRHMLGAKADGSNNQLLEYIPGSDPTKMTARVRIEGLETTIGYADFGASAQSVPQPPTNMNFPQQQQQPGMPQPPGAPQNAGIPPAAVQPASGNDTQPPRRVIRRRVISGQPPAAQPVPNQ